ncbi:hypothetical protein JCM8547_008627 [Rhodosporidiobolus lusitaniae]
MASRAVAGTAPIAISRPAPLSSPKPASPSLACPEPSFPPSPPQSPSPVTLFDLAHSRKHHHPHEKTKHEEHLHDTSHPLSWRHLFKRPVVRQWLAGGVLTNECAQRQAGRFELFFDLVFVGVLHLFAERAAEESSSWAIFKFLVFFYLSWSIWQDVRQFINVSGTDDLAQRLFVLLIMALLLGFSANASAVAIECGAVESTESSAEAGEAGETSHERRAFFHQFEAALGEAVNFDSSCELVEGWWKSARTEPGFLGFPLMALETPKLFVILPIVAISLDFLSSFTVPLILRFTHATPCGAAFSSWREDHGRRKGHMHNFVPAVNVDLVIERMKLFVVVVLGEMILNVAFTASGPDAGIHLSYLRSVFGLLIAFVLAWLYADVDASRTFLHALHRHWSTATLWQQLHFPLCAALILVSVAISSFMESDEPSQDMKWLFGASLAVTMFTLTLMGFLNKPLDVTRSALLPRLVRLSLRLAAALIFALLPLEHDLSATSILGVVVAVLVFVLIAETVGKLGSIADEEKVAEALRKRTDSSGESAPDALRMELGGFRVQGVEEGRVELTDLERGEDDAGVEGDLGKVRVTKLGRRQRLAYAF